ncbi:MAG: hypothetical protein HY287_00555 [Planctomycetes bacterium]|nr:hypothetical protein [Planctomycetota bacterium]MBI3832803.1 hypothetical protein [Planctomycetota bacterium]
MTLRIRGPVYVFGVVLTCLAFEVRAWAAPPGSESPGGNRVAAQRLSLSPEWEIGGKSRSEKKAEREKETKGESGEFDVDDFFNVASAYPKVTAGNWEFEAGTRWFTGAGEGDDDFLLVAELVYGLTKDTYLELAFEPINIGDGGDQGNGDLELEIFHHFVDETNTIPAMALYGEMRIPSGEGSSGVDGELRLSLTKTIAPKLRMHWNGFIETANGGRTEEERENGRHFQWGLGPGFDYEFSDKFLGIVNYLNRASEEYGEGNQNILELGLNYKMGQRTLIKAAMDVGLTGEEGEPKFGIKLQYDYEFGG